VLDDFVSLQMIQDGKKKEVKGAQDKGWVHEWKAFTKSIREGSGPPIPYEQLIAVSKAMFGVVESLRVKQTIKI